MQFRGRQHVAAILVVVLVALVAFQMFPGKDVVVLDEGRAVQVRATFDPSSEALDAADVNLGPNDRVLYSDTSGKASIAVQRARPVTVIADGDTVTLQTHASTVAGAVAEAGVEIRRGDAVLLSGTEVTERAPLDEAATFARLLQGAPTSPVTMASAQEADETPVITIMRARPIAVVVDGVPTPHRTAKATVGEVLDELGILIREGDIVEPDLSTPIEANTRIEIAQASEVTIVLDSKESTMYTQAQTVAGILAQLQLKPGPDDTVSPATATAIVDGMTVTIATNRVIEEEVDEPIEPPVVEVEDGDLAVGETRVEAGVEGLKRSVYEVRFENGREVSRTLVSSEVVREATPTRHITGTAQPVPVDVEEPATPAPPATAPPPPPAPTEAPKRQVPSQGFDGTYSRSLTVLATWYNASHGGKAPSDPWYGYTATGVKLDKGICATDPNVIPLGTWMYIPGYGTCLAADIGGGVEGNHVDLGFPESAGANPWGTQTIEIYILD